MEKQPFCVKIKTKNMYMRPVIVIISSHVHSIID